MRIALITGASSGLGMEFLKQLADDACIDEFWVVARRKERLESLQQLTAKRVVPIPMDITDKANIQILKKKLEEEKPVVTVLINAAGMGRIGRTDEISLEDNDRTIDLDVRAAVDVTTICFSYLERGSRILEICSTAGFQPIPYLNIYSASKAFLQYYAKCLHYELAPKGIRVTAVCPYWVKDTEFIGNAEKGKGKNGFKSYPLASRKADVVRRALRDSRRNLWVSTPGLVCTLDRFFSWILPDFIMVPIMDGVRRL